jgi:sugar phosphate permease
VSFSDIVSLIAALGIGGLIGSLLSSWLSSRAEAAKRSAEFCARQLQELYGRC